MSWFRLAISDQKADDFEMVVEEKKYPISKLVEAFKSGSLTRNEEYQRGEAWNDGQKAGFIDSIFRSYPVPVLFLHAIESPGLSEIPTPRWEIVDGQQRLISLRDFVSGKFPLLSTDGKSRLRIPKSIQAISSPWAGKSYSDLSAELQSRFGGTQITVYIIQSAHRDEVRDLFIRLQSGTALSRQQVRDAWPGNLGPFVERLAGKLNRAPSMKLFSNIDQRGQGAVEDDQRDRYVSERQVCAQLLRVFLARERDPNTFPAVSSNELDSIYHEYTDFDHDSVTAKRFQTALTMTADAFDLVSMFTNKKKVPRLDVTVMMMFFQDITKSEKVKFSEDSFFKLGKKMQEFYNEERKSLALGKSSSGATLKKYYEIWRERVTEGVGVYLAEQRLFDARQKAELWKMAAGICAVCKHQVTQEEAEYDHFPIPYRDGGPTEVSNGRLVHIFCHERGRPTSR